MPRGSVRRRPRALLCSHTVLRGTARPLATRTRARQSAKHTYTGGGGQRRRGLGHDDGAMAGGDVDGVARRFSALAPLLALTARGTADSAACATTAAFCWGDGRGSLGGNTVEDSFEPVAVTGGLDFTDVAAPLQEMVTVRARLGAAVLGSGGGLPHDYGLPLTMLQCGQPGPRRPLPGVHPSPIPARRHGNLHPCAGLGQTPAR
jgi:hypothetical protein